MDRWRISSDTHMPLKASWLQSGSHAKPQLGNAITDAGHLPFIDPRITACQTRCPYAHSAESPVSLNGHLLEALLLRALHRDEPCCLGLRSSRTAAHRLVGPRIACHSHGNSTAWLAAAATATLRTGRKLSPYALTAGNTPCTPSKRPFYRQPLRRALWGRPPGQRTLRQAGRPTRPPFPIIALQPRGDE